MSRIALVLLFVVGTTPVAVARDLWIIGGLGESVTGVCSAQRWSADPFLYNLSDTPAAIRVVHVSNGGANDQTNVVPAHGIKTSRVLGALADAPLWVSHLDVPDAILVEGRMEYFQVNTCTLIPPNPSPLGKVTMPVFNSLVPAGQEQVHLGTDLGRQSARVNVAIYNAAVVPASATVTIQMPDCHGSDAITEALIPPDSVLQIPLGTVNCTDGGIFPSLVTVVVDQASVSFVSTLSNDAPPGVSIEVSSP